MAAGTAGLPPMAGVAAGIAGVRGGEDQEPGAAAENAGAAPGIAGVAVGIAGLLPPGAGVRNPIDLAGAGERDLTTYATLVELLLDSGEVDGVVLTGYFGSYGADAPSLVDAELAVVDALGALVRRYGRPVIVHSMSRDSAAVQALRQHGVPTYATIDQVGWSLGLATELALRTPRPEARTPKVRPGLTESGYLGARAAFVQYGVPYPKAVAVRTVEQVRAAASTMRAPYVLKAAWVEHKSEVGGVAVGLRDAEEAVEAFTVMAARLNAKGENAEGEYVLEEMDVRPHAVELIVGGRRDPAFGPLVVVGAGGTMSELYRDVAVELAPVSVATAEAMLASLAASALLNGWRGAPAVDRRAAAEAVAAVSRMISEREDLLECEVNPLRVAPDGVLAVDALAVTA